MRTLIKNALIIPVDREDEHYFKGNILIENGKILEVGKTDEKADEIIDASHMIAIPGLINTHTHLAMVLMRNYKDDMENLQAWLAQIFPIEDKLCGDDIYTASLLGASELIMGGCTTFADMYFNYDRTLDAARKVGIKAVLGLTIFGDEKETAKRLAAAERDMNLHQEDPRYRFDLAPHAIYTCTKGTYEMVRDFAKEHNLFVHTHLSETKKEVEDSLNEFGMTPALYLDSINLFDARCYVAHGVHLTDQEMEILKKKNVSVVHNPSSNAKLLSGTFPLKKAMDIAVNVSLGTDGASSNNNLDMFEEMHVAAMIASSSGYKVKAYDILKMATINGARALGYEKERGSIEVGKDADIVLLNADTPCLCPLNNPVSALVFSASSECIDTVLVNGKTVMKNRKLTGIDIKSVMDGLRMQWEDIKKR